MIDILDPACEECLLGNQCNIGILFQLEDPKKLSNLWNWCIQIYVDLHPKETRSTSDHPTELLVHQLLAALYCTVDQRIGALQKMKEWCALIQM